MLKVNDTKVEIKGIFPDIMTELTILVRNIYQTLSKNEKPEFVKESLQKSFDLALMSDDEIHNEVKKKLKEVMKTMFDDLDEIFEDLED